LRKLVRAFTLCTGSAALASATLASGTPAWSASPIEFDDVAAQAGVANRGPTAASAWGDLNGDGWPDLWVSNHHGEWPNLFLNLGTGAFRDVARESLALDPKAELPDYHGAAWGDFDRDGDDDLLVVTGGGAGRGTSANTLFVNARGRLLDEAGARGIDYPLGRGRTPLWMDADRDGAMDAVIMNKPRKEAPSAVFLQGPPGKFATDPRHAIGPAGARPARGWFDPMYDWLVGTPSDPGTIAVGEEFATLADLDGDRHLELVAFSRPTRILDTRTLPFTDVTAHWQLPEFGAVQDAALGDFDGDGRTDWLLARSRPYALEVALDRSGRLQARVNARAGKPTGLVFTTTGTVTLEAHRPWMDPTDPARAQIPRLAAGSRTLALDGSLVVLDPADPAFSEEVAERAGTKVVALRFEPASATWTLMSGLDSLGIEVRSSAPITAFAARGFESSDGAAQSMLLVADGPGYRPRPVGPPLPCHGVAAGDFDNDMDLDAYLVCATPTGNLPDRILVNDGRGHFSVHEVGRAAPGRGNQASVADYDRDGFLDVFVTNGAGQTPFATAGLHQLLRNRGNTNHWLEIDLAGVTSNPAGLGATVVVTTAGRSQTRHAGSGAHSYSQDHGRLHFGLGPNALGDRLTVYWPSGIVDVHEHVAANQVLTVRESGPAPIR
jgi:hypothetical protein